MVKIQMFDFFCRKEDVYIDSCSYACASLQLTPQLPSGLFAEPPLDSGGVDDGDPPKLAGKFRH